MPPLSSQKKYYCGTHRIRSPDQTWSIIEPKLFRFGITRLADVTGLDTIGIPVVMAVRPLSKSLSVSQGKGQTLMSAKVSAAMESIELWHAETAYPELVHRQMPGSELDLPYRVRDLPTTPGSLVTEATLLDWIRAVGLQSGCATLLPFDVVCFDNPRGRWKPVGLGLSSNGLASGNSRDEAVLHGLYEVIERDAISMLSRPTEQTVIDPSSVDDVGCAEMIARIRAAGVRLRLVHVPSRFGIPCFLSWVWSEEFPVLSVGQGAHLAPEVALSRAITEAVQSRLTSIAGSRDDLPQVYDHVQTASPTPPLELGTMSTWAEVVTGCYAAGASANLADDLGWLTAQIQHVVGSEPLLVDLSTDTDFAVVKVVVPGAVIDMERIHPIDHIPDHIHP